MLLVSNRGKGRIDDDPATEQASCKREEHVRREEKQEQMRGGKAERFEKAGEYGRVPHARLTPRKRQIALFPLLLLIQLEHRLSI